MATTDFDPSVVLDRLSPRDAVQLARLLIEDLRRNRALLGDSLAAKDYVPAERAAHSLGSVAANAGCESVCTTAATVEHLLRGGQTHEAERLSDGLCTDVELLIDVLDGWLETASVNAIEAAPPAPRRAQR